MHSSKFTNQWVHCGRTIWWNCCNIWYEMCRRNSRSIFCSRWRERHFQLVDSRWWEVSWRWECHTYALDKDFADQCQCYWLLSTHIFEFTSSVLKPEKTFYQHVNLCNEVSEWLSWEFYLWKVLMYSSMCVEEWAWCCRACCGVMSQIASGRRSAVTQLRLVLVLWPTQAALSWISCSVSHAVEYISNAKKASRSFSEYMCSSFPLLLFATFRV